MSDLRGGAGSYSKPPVVPEDLLLLTGRTAGVVHLPVHLDWSGCAVYDLDRPGRIVDLYRAVINEEAVRTEARRGLVEVSKTYTAKVIRDEDALSIEVPEVDRVTQALDLRQVDAMARDLIVVMDDIDPDEIELSIEWPADITARMVYRSR